MIDKDILLHSPCWLGKNDIERERREREREQVLISPAHSAWIMYVCLIYNFRPTSLKGREVCNQVLPFVGLLYPGKHHFRSRNILLRLLQISVKGAGRPFNPFALHCYGVIVAGFGLNSGKRKKNCLFTGWQLFIYIHITFIFFNAFSKNSLPHDFPSTPHRFGPILCLPSLSAVWHCAQYLLKYSLPLAASPISDEIYHWNARTTVRMRQEEVNKKRDK